MNNKNNVHKLTLSNSRARERKFTSLCSKRRSALLGGRAKIALSNATAPFALCPGAERFVGLVWFWGLVYGTFLLYEQLHVQETPHLLRVSVGSQVAATGRSNKGSLTLTSARPPIQFPLCFERARTTAFDAVHKKARRKPRTLPVQYHQPPRHRLKCAHWPRESPPQGQVRRRP